MGVSGPSALSEPLLEIRAGPDDPALETERREIPEEILVPTPLLPALLHDPPPELWRSMAASIS